MYRIHIAVRCFILTSAGAAALALGGTANAGSFTGRVSDAAGHGLEGVAVTAQNPARAKAVTVFTDAQGAYRLPALGDGPYKLRARRLGFTDHTRANVSAASDAVADFTLEALSAAAWAEQAPASVWAARIRLDDTQVHDMFRIWCMMCHQQGQKVARWPTSREEWYSVFDRMAHKTVLLTADGREVIADALLKAYRGVDPRELAPPPDAVSGAAGRAEITEWQMPEALSNVHDAAVGPDGRIYASDMALDTFWRLDPRNDEIKRFDLLPYDPEYRNFFGIPSKVLPHSAIAGPDGAVWMTLAIGNQVIRIDPRTDEIKHFDVPSDGFYPHTMRFDAAGDLWFTVAFSNHLGKLDVDTGEIELISLPTRNFSQRLGALMPRAMIWLVQKLDITTTTDSEVFTIPYGIDIAPDGAVWVSQFNNRRLLRYEPASGAVEVVETPFAGPRRFRIDSKGMLWIPAYAEGRVYRYDPAMRVFTPYDLPTGRGDAAYALAVDPADDTVWICGTNSDTMMHLDPKDGAFVTYRFPTHVTYCREVDFDEQGNVWTTYSNFPTGHIEGGLPVIVRLRRLDAPPRQTAAMD